MTFQIEINGLPVTAGFSEENIEEIFLPLLKHLTKLQSGLGRRILVFLAAPPGAGKSTLAEFLKYLSENTPGVTPVTITGMDGFHRRQGAGRVHPEIFRKTYKTRLIAVCWKRNLRIVSPSTRLQARTGEMRRLRIRQSREMRRRFRRVLRLSNASESRYTVLGGV